MPRISLVVPAYNEEGYLPRLLDSVDRARARYPGGPEAVEVIVADNASTDATARMAAARGWHYLTIPLRVGWDLLRRRAAIRRWARLYWYEDR